MGLFENIVVNAKQAANAVGKKTGELVDVSKLKLQSVDLSGEIRKNYEALGKAVYEAHKLGIESTEEIEDIIILINEKYDELDEVNEQLSKMGNKAICSKCGASNVKTSSFCGQCGERLVQETAQNDCCTHNDCGCGCAQETVNSEQTVQPDEPNQYDKPQF